MILSPVVTALTALVAAPASGQCPSIEAVSAALARIGKESTAGGGVSVEETPDGFILRGRAIGVDRERHIATVADCAERAEIAAVVVASWRRSATFVSLDDESLRKAVADGFPTPRAQPVAQPSERMRLGASVIAGVDALGPSLALDPETEIGFGRFSARVSLHLPLPRTASLQPGSVVWFAPGLTLSGVWRPTRGLSTHAGLTGVLTAATGRGFDRNATATTWQWGGVLGARYEPRVLLHGAFFELRAALVPTGPILQVKQGSTLLREVATPDWVVLAGLGFSWSV